ncbi:MAG: XrtA system polysaccharide deacetylase, partial [Pseudomonadota bacterium]
MSVDVEDYFHAWAITSVIGKKAWSSLPSRVGESTRRLLDLFDRRGIKATFFTLGWVAEREPALVRDIVARGHELASHGFGHDKVHELTPQAFLEDIRKTRLLLEDQAGVSVKGYRAPSFSIDERNWWAFDVLAEAGYVYSSSLHPIRHDHYGMPHAPLVPFRTGRGAIVEIPVAVIDWRGRRISCAGGGHFRIFPYPWSRWGLGRLQAENDRTGVFYLHPWEVDPGQPRIPDLPLRSRLRHYTGLGRMMGKLDRLIGELHWDRIDRLVDFDNAAPWSPPSEADRSAEER